MRVLLSSIGSRGDVQPIVALGVELAALGHEARLCAAPNFGEWIESYGLEFVPIGPDLRKMTGGSGPVGVMQQFTKEQWQKLAEDSVRDQFRVLGEAARGCDVLVAAGALQIALRSVAEAQGVPYVFAAYCPAVLPSAKVPPPKMGGHYAFDLPEAENLQLWKQNADEFDARFGAVLNEQRSKIGLGPVASVQPHIFTDHPWLAADPLLGPAFPTEGLSVEQTGAWLLADDAPLPEEVEEFLGRGEPPVYLGFGSMRGTDQTAGMLVAAARALGLRCILSRGWADLAPVDDAEDCISVGDVNHARLFPRVRAVVHHGGAGTTTAAARAGRPQVIVPHNYDQFYWAHRVQVLGVGAQGPLRDELSVEGVTEALRACLRPEVGTAARALPGRMVRDGARRAASLIVS